MFSVKGKTMLYSICEAIWSVIATQLCPGGTKAATDNMLKNECGCSPVKLYLQKKQWAGCSP